MKDLTTRFGFKKICSLRLDDDNRISRDFARPREYMNVIYAIVINGEIVYLGKTNCLWKRFDTYRNSKYWKNANESNKIKTDLLERHILVDNVELYVRQCPMMIVGDGEKQIVITSMHLEEPRIIKFFSPAWNTYYT